MAVHFVRWVFTETKETAEDGSAQPRQLRWFGPVQFAADAQPVPLAGLVAPLQYLSDVHLLSARVIDPSPAADDPAEVELYPSPDDLGLAFLLAVNHSTNDAAPHTVPVVASTALSDVTYGGVATMEVPLPQPYLRLSGATLALWAVAPGDMQVVVDYNEGRARSRAEFGGFVDDTDDTLPSVQNTSADLLRYLLTKPAGAFVVTNGDRSQTTLQVQYTAVAPTGEVWVRNSQIGSNSNQIPPSASLNTPERYAFHPSVFIRRSHLSAQLESVADPREPAITATRGVLAIWQVVRAPTHSRWLFILDGVPRVVVLQHPAGADLRTPYEIWQGLIVPLLQDGGDVSVPIFRQDGIIGGPKTFNCIGALSAGQLRSLDYARFLEPLDTNTASIVTLYAQTV